AVGTARVELQGYRGAPARVPRRGAGRGRRRAGTRDPSSARRSARSRATRSVGAGLRAVAARGYRANTGRVGAIRAAAAHVRRGLNAPRFDVECPAEKLLDDRVANLLIMLQQIAASVRLLGPGWTSATRSGDTTFRWAVPSDASLELSAA